MGAEKIHLIGVGGSGMSGLAKILLARGHVLSGSDLRATEVTEQLSRLGVRVSIGHREENIPEGVDLVIRSAAIRDDNPELARAKQLGVRVLKYSQMVGQLSRDRETLVVAGTHGKTTTAAMLAHILETANLTPSYLIGSPLLTTGTNACWGRGTHFVVEGCEYDRSFLNLHPRDVVITNIEEDHLDYYRNIDEILEAFLELCGRIPEDGSLFVGIDTPESRRLLKRVGRGHETVSIEREADWRAFNIEWEPEGMRFEVMKYGKIFDEFTVAVHGEHNVANAVMAVAAATCLGVGKEIIQLALSKFRGTRRRMEVLGEANGLAVIDDYAHHPTEIRATLSAVKRRYPGRRIWAIFQPHQESRTRYFLKTLASSFEDADVVLVPDIYRAREEVTPEGISSHDLARRINSGGKPALFLPTFEEIEEFVERKVGKDGVLVTLGAGDIQTLARRLAGRIRKAV